MTKTIDPAQLEYCLCGRVIQSGKGYFCCRPCWLSAPEFFRIKFYGASELKRNQARNQILLHARRRADRSVAKSGSSQTPEAPAR